MGGTWATIQHMKILAVETSCDETALALVEARGGLEHPKFEVEKDIVSSQIEVHRPWGGVVPNLAKREHLKNLPLVLEKLGAEEGSVDTVAVTVGPGLEPALWTGIGFAKEVHGRVLEKNPEARLVGVNHLEGHLFSFLLENEVSENMFPAIALIASGGHTILLHMESLVSWKKLGETRDDAVGEAFDKVAKMLGFPYPGGPEIERLAKEGDPEAIEFPRPMIHAQNYDFSYSGLKTSVLYYLRDNPDAKKEDVAASFQRAALDLLISKTMKAAEEFGAQFVLLSGGVAANRNLRERLGEKTGGRNLGFLVPPGDLNTDNAVMIAIAGYMGIQRKTAYPLEANGHLGL